MQWLYRAMVNGIKGSMVILTLLITFSVSWGVFTRYVLQSSASWTGEFSGYSLVWITMLGTAYAIIEKTHIRFESFVEILPKPIRIVIQTVFQLLMLLFVGVITVYGWKLAIGAMGDETLSLPFTKGVVYLILPIAGVIMLIGLLIELVNLYRRGEEKI